MQARLLGEDKPVARQDDYIQTTKRGYALDEVVSSLTKEIRRGNESEAMFWAMEMVTSGYAKYFWTRLGVLVPEEIGLADPMAMLVVNNAFQMFERRIKKWSEGPFTTELVGMVVLYLCRAPKNGEAAYAAYAVEMEIDAGHKLEVPEYGRDMHTRRGRDAIRAGGMNKEEEELWWWLELNKKENLKPGNRWVRRLIQAITHLTSTSKQEVIQDGLTDYGETMENQL